SRAYEYSFGGKAARVYSFDVWKCRFVLLDNTEYGDQIPWKEQLKMADEWLGEKADLKKFVFVHSPPHEVEKWAYHSMPARMSEPFVDLMSKHSVDKVFLGHIHAFSTATYEDVEYMIVGGGGAGLHSHYGEMGSVHSYVIVDVLPGSVKMRLVRLLPDPDKD
ncbi:metallophosphoesterase family protein, partial [Acidobacteriota bacterium]